MDFKALLPLTAPQDLCCCSTVVNQFISLPWETPADAEISLLPKKRELGVCHWRNGNKSKDGRTVVQVRELAFLKERAAGKIEISYGSNSQAGY